MSPRRAPAAAAVRATVTDDPGNRGAGAQTHWPGTGTACQCPWHWQAVTACGAPTGVTGPGPAGVTGPGRRRR